MIRKDNMIKKETALQIKKRARAAIAELDGVVSDVRGQCSDEDFQVILRGVGLSIGLIATELLEPVFAQHPEIDDLK